MRKGKKAAVELPNGPSFFPAGGEEVKARFRYHSLLQDYQDLLKETEAKREQLEKGKHKKRKLLAQVRFLRGRYKSLTQNPSRKFPYKLKKSSQNMRLQEMDDGQATMQLILCEASNKENKVAVRFTGRDSSAPSTSSAGIDLNKVSLPNGEEMQEFQVEWETMGTDKPKKRAIGDDDGAFSTDLKLAVCRGTGNGSRRAGKRKITWQDQVALKV